MSTTPLLLSVFPTFDVGGAQTRFAALANHLGGEARHLIVSVNGGWGALEKLDPALDVTQAPPIPRGIAAAWRFLRAHRHAAWLITSNWGAMDWAIANRAAGLPHLHMEDGFGPEEQDRQLPRRVWTRRVVLRGSEILLPSRTLLTLARDRWRLPERRLQYMPNGINTRRFACAQPVTAPLDALGPGPVIGTIAALRPEKNLGRLLEAFALLRRRQEARLVIVGDGPERPALEAQAARLGIAPRVLFAGHSAEPERWMAAFGVFALSSDTEQMPLSVLEAMAAGLPVVATDVGDVRHMVAEKNAALIVPRNAAAIAEALGRALASGAGPANAARAARDYDQAAMFARFRALLRLGPPQVAA